MKSLFDENQINIGVGTWQLGMRGWGKDYSSSDAKEALKFLINNGIKFIDTAEIYGNGESEKNVGEVLSNSKRDKYYIATKIAGSNFKASKIKAKVEGSLKRLKLDYIDLYQVHWEPSAYTNLKESFKELEKICKEGLIMHIGVSNFGSKKIREVSNYLNEYKIESNQIKYNILERPVQEEINYLNENNIKIIAWSPLGQGFLTGKYIEKKPTGFIRKVNRLFRKESLKKYTPLFDFIKNKSQELNIAPATLVLSYEIKKGVIPIPGFKNIKQAEDIVKVLSFSLNDQIVKEIDDLVEPLITRYSKMGFYPPLLPNFIVNLIIKGI